ncbi:MAG: MFS transporter [Frankiaceae bacterium]|nr:MFS transporter [Frankiaceae bacterium]
MFVSILSSTIVTNALPRISRELKGSESQYTWVVAATLLAMTASTPIWGKLADRLNRKMLMQLALALYTVASIFAGFSQSMGMLIGARALQGIGSGGVMSLSQIIIGAVIPPRERGRYSGYMGATFALATVLGPLIGGAMVDTPFIGWRGCFYGGLPFIVVAFALLQRNLQLPYVKRKVPIDYSGGLLITTGVSLLLIWVSMAGSGVFGWTSSWGVFLVIGSTLLVGAAIYTETQATDPVVPLSMFRHRTVSFAVLGSVFMGCAMAGSTVFMGQYFQIAQGHSAVIAGMLTLPLVVGMFGMSLVSGRLISAYGKWKRYLVGGSVCLFLGVIVLSRLSIDTPMIVISAGMFLVGIGIGSTNQNLVLAVQNTVPLSQLGAGSSIVSFFRSLGSAAGLSVLGAVMSAHLSGALVSGFTRAGIAVPHGAESGGIPNIAAMPPRAGHIVASSYADSIALVFLCMIPLIAISLMFICMIKEVPLRSKDDMEYMDDMEHLDDLDAEANEATAPPVGRGAPVPVGNARSRDGQSGDKPAAKPAGTLSGGSGRLRRRSGAGARAGV